MKTKNIVMKHEEMLTQPDFSHSGPVLKSFFGPSRTYHA